MGDSDFKTWALVIILAVGGTWQISKSIFKSSAGQKAASFEATVAENEFEPYSVSGGDARPNAPGFIRHQGPTPAAVTVEDQQLAKFLATSATATEATDKAAPKKEDKCEPKTDKATGKVIPCDLKKKKKKKKVVAKQEETINPLPKTASKPIDAETKGIEWNVGAAIQTGRVNAVNTKPDQAFESLEAWQARLLGSPNVAETKVFIDHYQRNLVTSEVFYKITQAMLDDSRSDMKLLGVMCAGVTSSMSSFQVLAQFIAKERTGTAPRAQADAALARYTDIGSLSILASVLRGNSIESATILAAQKLDVAAKRFLVTTTPTEATTPAATPTPAPGTTTTTPAAPTVNKNRQYFTRFVSILTTLSKASDPQVRDQAARSLTNLNGLLGTEVAAPTTPALPSTTPTTT